MSNFKTFESKELNGGIQYKAFFDNGYGASIVKHSFSYGNEDGLWELAVLESNGRVCYDTPIASSVIGYLSEEEVDSIIEDIKKLD